MMIAGCTVLLVDDEAAICASLAWALEKQGFIVVTAESGEAAIDYLRNNRCDLVVSDLIMGDVNGLEVLHRAKELYPGICVILLTGYGDVTSAVEAMQSGADDYVQKPCEPDELLKKIERALEHRNLLATLQRQKEQLVVEIKARTTAENELLRSQDSLEMQVSERTVELNDHIKEMKHVLQILLDREEELQGKNKELEELNSTLRTMLRHWEDEHAAIRNEIALKIYENVLPLLKKALSGASGSTRGFIESAQALLLDLNARQLPNTMNHSARLSPRELQVVHLLRQNKTSKEMAELLELSVRTIEFYRANIRKKINIANQKKNLKNFILSIP